MPTLETPRTEASFPSKELDQQIQRVTPCECCGALKILTPKVMCAHCGGPLNIRCQVYRQKGAYFAECLTLNLLSRGETEAEAIRRLQVAMFSYVATVAREGESAEGLIPRHAPAASWLRYFASQAKNRVAYLVGRKLPRYLTIPTGDMTTLADCS
jgi:predicted RNase H-like HicB family nuclease